MEPPIQRTRYSITATRCWKRKLGLLATMRGFIKVWGSYTLIGMEGLHLSTISWNPSGQLWTDWCSSLFANTHLPTRSAGRRERAIADLIRSLLLE
jgi:hypothetical protein